MSAFASRYARAFADVVAQFHLGAPEVEKQLNDFLATWDDSQQLREVFGDPSVPADQKIAVLDAMKAKLNLAPQVRNFIAVLIEHGRISAVHEVVAEYKRELKQRMGIYQAEVDHGAQAQCRGQGQAARTRDRAGQGQGGSHLHAG